MGRLIEDPNGWEEPYYEDGRTARFTRRHRSRSDEDGPVGDPPDDVDAVGECGYERSLDEMGGDR